MIDPDLFLDNCYELGYRIFAGTPCSYMKNLINCIINNNNINFIETPNEGDAVAFATGVNLTGNKSIVVFQNSGLGNAVNPLTSLSYIFKIPFIGIVTLRGEAITQNNNILQHDEPQHQLMGKITTKLLDIMEIPWEYFPNNNKDLKNKLKLADQISINNSKPFFFVLKKNTINKSNKNDVINNTKLKNNNYRLSKYINYINIKNNKIFNIDLNNNLSRYNALNLIKEFSSKKDLIISTTGKTSRELYTISDDSNNFYMVGSMGCALSIALGIHTGLNNKLNNNKILVIDGDGALLMRMGNMALAGRLNPKNLVHILLDNGVHDSTGGQKTFSEKIDFCKIAESCGYQFIYQVDNSQDLITVFNLIKNHKSLTFIRIIIKPGSIDNLGRPSVCPDEVANRFKKYINNIYNK